MRKLGNIDSVTADTPNQLLINRSRYGVYCYLPFWFLFSNWSGDLQKLSVFFTVNTILLVSTAFVGHFFVSKYRGLTDFDPKLLLGIIFFRSLHWGAITAYLLYYGIENPGLTSALLIVLVIFATGGMALLSFNLFFSLSCTLLMVIPTIIMSIMNPELLDPKFIILATFVFISLVFMTNGMNQYHLSSFKQTQELYFLASSMENLSKIDYLTQTYNRFGFSLEFENMWREHLSTKRSICLLFLTIDQLSTIRRKNGAKAAETCLKEVAACLKGHLKPAYVLGLYGSEEFMIALPDSNLTQGKVLAAELNKACETLTCGSDSEEEMQITSSIGITNAIPNNKTQPESMLLKAHQALSQAKSNGGNGFHAIEL